VDRDRKANYRPGETRPCVGGLSDPTRSGRLAVAVRLGKTLVRSPGPILAGEGHKDSESDRKNSGRTSDLVQTLERPHR
ncbi:MAG: hypothetical protein ABGX04_18840, partial [Myxococcales bacterium]